MPAHANVEQATAAEAAPRERHGAEARAQRHSRPAVVAAAARADRKARAGLQRRWVHTSQQQQGLVVKVRGERGRAQEQVAREQFRGVGRLRRQRPRHAVAELHV